MSSFFSRLGIAGISIIVAALIFGSLAGGIVVYRLTAAPQQEASQTQEDQHGDQGDKKADHKASHAQTKETDTNQADNEQGD